MAVNVDLSNYRIEIAEEKLQMAKTNFNEGSLRDAANNLYLCVFNSMRGILALERKDFKRHTGVISYFREKYIKTNLIELKLSKIIDDVSNIRNKGEYDRYADFSKEEILAHTENAEYFLKQIKDFQHKNKYKYAKFSRY